MLNIKLRGVHTLGHYAAAACKQKVLSFSTAVSTVNKSSTANQWLHRQTCKKLSSPHTEQGVIATIDSFVSAGMVQEAEPLFNLYRRQGHQFDVDVYNILLDAWAAQSNKIRASVLYDTMPGDRVERSIQTYAIMLALCAQFEDWSCASEICEELKSKGHKLESILHTASLSRHDTQLVLKVLSHFGVTPMTPPPPEVVYPRVVQSLYKQWRQDTQSGKELSHPPVLKELFKDEGSLKRCLENQLDIERKSFEVVRSIAVTTRKATKDINVKEVLKELRQSWKEQLTAVIKNDIEEFRAIIELIPDLSGTFRGPKQFPFLALLPAEDWASLLVDQVLMSLIAHPDGMPIQYVNRQVGQAAWTKYSVIRKEKRGLLDKIQLMYEQYIEKLQSPVHSNRPEREIWNETNWNTISYGSLECDPPKWTRVISSHVVSALLERLLEVATVPVNFAKPHGPRQSAFEHLIITPEPEEDKRFEPLDNYKKMGFIRATKSLYSFARHYHKDTEEFLHVSSFLLPMLVPPRPWTAPHMGGYLLSPFAIIRCPEDTYQHQLLLEQANNLNAVYDSLNYIGNCPWAVNGPILDLVIQLFNGGGDTKLEIPSCSEFILEKSTRLLSAEELKQRNKVARESFSLWMDMLYRLSLANHYRDKVFWLPHNMDFRGRVYPIPPHLTHIAMDVGRAMLKFGVGYPLGEGGLDWLKIHIITLQGAKKKESMEVRLQFANDIIDDIIDSADNPLTGKKWWQSGDDPWQVLACCVEIANAIRSGDPSSFVSHLPVHQDGSCNGLQHYAAMGRDYLGGKQVNLIPQDQPEDTYAAVASVVEQLRKKDADNGHEIATILEGKINRKVVKTTVMTVVYGVTWIGGRLQIEKQIDGHVPDDQLWNCSNYLVGNVFASLRESFANARFIQDWLASSARKVSLAGRPMEWITPLGLPIVQPYHKQVMKQAYVKLQSVAHTTSSDFTTPPDTRRQKMGMPPNFVHSIDSTHMMLTSLHCHRAGVPFVAVHDSYWTHPCFVNKMNQFCREQFVALHEEPILEDLADAWEEKYGRLEYKEIQPARKVKCQFRDPFPSIGDLNLKQVLKSTYFFS
ncbi:DNA-directed RNA polymerase, mitochondrial-like isoform X2 [Halichondria panicea]|uniref:DNA-directed RNA polymerase, mitochondrial-like isoform X2 n=1 Tax=Halichondria panicea TaxID=6063 RepID=UPI00312BC238